MCEPQPLDCQTFCEIQRKSNIARGSTRDESDSQYNSICMPSCKRLQTDSQTPWPCLLASRDLKPENLDARVKQCAESLHSQ